MQEVKLLTLQESKEILKKYKKGELTREQVLEILPAVAGG